MRPVTAAGLALICLVAGVFLGRILAPTGMVPPDDPAPSIPALQAELSTAREARDALQARVEGLELRLEALAVAGEARDESPGDPALEPPGHDGPAVSEAAAHADAAGFDEARLQALGLHPSEVERLRRAWEELELQRLYIENDRARSDKHDGRHWMRMRALENQTLEDLGESDYDALLYAAGSQNRVRVKGVFPESPAEAAGFVEGDEILVYGDMPIYRAHDVKAQTTSCELDTSVAVTVLRDGRERRMWTPCGPLGLQLEMVNAPPR